MKRHAGSEVRISQLKAQLSEHLRAVRLGREIIIKDRETAIARLTPLKSQASLSAVVRRCGKPNCHCAKPDDPGHDPQLRLVRKVSGKSVAESFASPASFRKAQHEVAEFHRMQSLSAELIALNEQICRLRPVEPDSADWTAQEKKRVLQSIRRSRVR
jgi:antitoxin (DNA-binding transcriptional repressor) of toxin-antitoxin stability system